MALNATLSRKLKFMSEYDSVSYAHLKDDEVENCFQRWILAKSKNMNLEEKEDFGLLLLMIETDPKETMSREDVFKIFEEKL